MGEEIRPPNVPYTGTFGGRKFSGPRAGKLRHFPGLRPRVQALILREVLIGLF